MEDLINGRCGWCGTDELYMAYHDQEWGKLVTDDKTLSCIGKLSSRIELDNNPSEA